MSTSLRKGLARSRRDVSSPAAFALVLALVVMGPLLLPGRVLTLDSPLALNRDIAGYFWGTSDGARSVFAATYNSAPVAAVHRLVEYLLPVWLVEKLWLVLLLWLAGAGASRLPHVRGAGRYYAVAFYVVNPFSYARFVAGQWGVLGAYALAPFAVASFVRLMDRPGGRHAVTTALLLTAIGFMQVHGLLLVLLIFLVLYVARVATAPEAFRRSLPALLASAAIFLGLNLFWMVRYLSGGGVIDNIGAGELRYFAASPPLDALALGGFWLGGPYIEASDLLPVWWLFFAFVVFLAVYGALRMAGQRGLRWLAVGLSATALLGLALAAAPGWSVAEPTYRVLWENVPPYRVFRDSHKFVALVALAYAYLGGYGLRHIIEAIPVPASRQAWRGRTAVALAVASPLVLGLPMLFGAWGQLRSVEFPDDWRQACAILDADSQDYSVLVLPWHMYIDFPWLPNRWRRLANPAPVYFSQPVIAGDNIEAGATESNSSDPVSAYVEAFLDHAPALDDFGRHLAPLNVRYVLVYKAADYREVDYMRERDDLELAFEGDTVALFRNLSPTSAAYVLEREAAVNDLDDYFARASAREPQAVLYRLRSSATASGPDLGPVDGEWRPAVVDRSTPLSYRVRQEAGGYLTLALPQGAARDGWEHEGETGDLHLGALPAFRAEPGENAITFGPFWRLHLPLYGLALVTLGAAVVTWRRWA